MSELASGVTAVSGLVSAGTKAYGAFYSGGQEQNYYGIQSALTLRSKSEAERSIQLQMREAALVQDQADQTLVEAEYIKKIGVYKETQFQDESDTGISKGFAKMAKSGVAMNFGSPMDVINHAVNERAKSYDMLKWQNDVDYYQKKTQAINIHEKATIMLDTAKVNQSNLPMYDYQAQMYAMAGEEAAKAASIKQTNAWIGALGDVFGAFSKTNYFTPKTNTDTPTMPSYGQIGGGQLLFGSND